MCKVLQVSTSAYYNWLVKKPSKQELYNQLLLVEIKEIFKRTKGRYGSPRIAKELQMNSFVASRQLVAKLMRLNNMRSITKKKFKITTASSHKYPVVENVLNREFQVARQNQAWVSDLTYVRTEQGWLYLTTVIDLFDRKVIGWALSRTMKTKDTSVKSFEMAVKNRPINPNEKLIFHSDRGIQYACEEFTSHLSKYKSIVRSMSRKGNCWDNAVAESFFKTIKIELIYQNKYKTIEQAELDIFEYIEAFYNTKRRHVQLKNLTITEYQNQFINNLKMVA